MTGREDRLTQTILAKWFRDELVSTEAELARQEGREFELASALLEPIHAARAAGPRKATEARDNGPFPRKKIARDHEIT
jgi:type I restriction enzyme S subunit